MKKILKKLKEHWDLEDPWQIAIILFIFSISGISVLYIRRLLFRWLGFNAQTPLWEEVIAWISIIVPSYQLLLLIFGSILGQFEFFWHFEKDNLRRIKNLFTKLNSLL